MKKYLLITIFTLFLQPLTFAENIQQIYLEATKTDPTYQAALANAKSIALQYNIDFAALLPQLSLAGSIEQDWAHQKNSTPSSDTATTGSFNLTLNQVIFSWGQWLLVQQDNLTTKQAMVNLELAAQNLILRVVNAYFDVLIAEDQLTFAKSEQEADKKQYLQAKQRFNVGLTPITDSYNAKAKYDQTSANVISAQNDYENAKENLRILIGYKPYKLAKLSTKKFKPTMPRPASLNFWLDTAEHSNLNIISAEYAYKISQKSVSIAFSQHLPTISGTATYTGLQSNKTSALIGGTSKDYKSTLSAKLTANLAIYQGGGILAATRQARFNKDAAYENYIQAKRTTETLIKQLYNNITQDLSLIKARIEAVKSAQVSVQSTKACLLYTF